MNERTKDFLKFWAPIWLVGLAFCLFLEVVKAQTSESGLRVHRKIGVGLYTLTAVCDEANGTMVYVGDYVGIRSGVSVAVSAVPNGCKKVEAVR